MDEYGVKDPLDLVEWLDVDSLDGNSWNPNMVFGPELKLLEFSILSQGWLQPVLATHERIIIDGFHRWRLARNSQSIRERWDSRLPCVLLNLSRPEAMALTVRINRAKGSHAALKMHELVTELLNVHGWPREQVALEIGATLKEVDLLHQEGVFALKKTADYAYSKAWVPRENGKASKDSPDPSPRED